MMVSVFNPFAFLAQLLALYEVLLIIRIIMSWVQPFQRFDKQPMLFLYQVTEFSMAPFRRLIPPIGGTIDISCIFLFILINILRGFMGTLAIQYGPLGV